MVLTCLAETLQSAPAIRRAFTQSGLLLKHAAWSGVYPSKLQWFKFTVLLLVRIVIISLEVFAA